MVAFQPVDVRVRAVAELIGDYKNAYRMPYHLAVEKGGVCMPAALRYCPACCLEMLKKYGEPYWRRDHQLPGVFVCPLHGTPLAESKVALTRATSHEYIAANAENCPLNPGPQPYWANQEQTVRLLHEIAISSSNLLILNPSGRSTESIKKDILIALRARGFGAGKLSLNLPALQSAFAVRLAPILKLVPDAVPGNWLKEMNLKYARPLIPIRYIVLNILITSMSTGNAQDCFGNKPWICPNPLVGHFGKAVIDDCELHEECGEIRGVFRCSCGYVFSRSNAVDSRVKVLDYSPIFSTRLHELVCSGLGLKEIAQTLHVSYATALHQVGKLGLKVERKARAKRTKQITANRETMRELLIKAQNENPGMTKELLRQKIPDIYMWLHCYDRAWLHAQSFGKRPNGFHSRNKYWSSIDSEKAQFIQEEAARLIILDPPVRVTRSALKKVVGKWQWMAANLHRLPLSTSALDSLEENVYAFQRRRILWAAKKIKLEELPCTVTCLRRLAGLSGRCVAFIEDFLRETIDNL